MDVNHGHKIYCLKYQRSTDYLIYNILKIIGQVTMETVLKLTYTLTRDTCYLHLTIKLRIALLS